MEDFETHSSSDSIHCEYEEPLSQTLNGSTQNRNHTSSPADWRSNRSSCASSWFKSAICSFTTTIIGGVSIGVIATAVMWLDINLGENCFNYNNRWYEMPVNVRRIRLTTQVIEGMVIQFWSLTCILAIFGWPLVKELNLLNWNMLVAFMDGIYRLFLDVYGQYNRKWASYPLNVMFSIITLFNGYRVARHFRSRLRQSLSLAVKLEGQFYMCIPVAFLLNYLVVPYYKELSESERALLASFLPAILIIPKALGRVFAERVTGINHPGTSFVSLIATYTGGAMYFRVLQAGLEKFSLYFVLCIVHGLESTIDKITLPLRDYIYHKCCTESGQSVREFRTPRVNRLLADLALLSMIVEAGSIFLSCAIVEIFRYYYGRDSYGHKYMGLDLFKSFMWRVSIGIIIEWIFNILAIKIQTYYYNIPVCKVWRFRWRWIMPMIILHTIITMLYFSESLYNAAVSRPELFGSEASWKCVLPFKRA